MLKCKTRFIAVAATALVAAGGMSLGGDRDKPSGHVSPELERLEMFHGLWNVTQHHYNERGERIGTVKGKEDITWILDDHAIQRTYMTGKEPSVYQALGTLTFNGVEKKYEGVWSDNISTAGLTTLKGDWNEENRTFVFTVKSLAQDGSTVQHKVVERFLDENTRIATTYLVAGEELVKRLEVHYRRTLPCPGKMRAIDELGG